MKNYKFHPFHISILCFNRNSLLNFEKGICGNKLRIYKEMFVPMLKLIQLM